MKNSIWFKFFQVNIVYAIGNAANSLALFLLIPLLVNSLSPVDFGIWSIFEVLVILFNILLLSGMDVGMMREYWFLSDEKERRQLVGSVLITVIVNGLLWMGLLSGLFLIISRILIFNDWIAQLPVSTLRLALTTSFFESIFTLLLALFRIREQATQYVFLSVGRMIVFIVAVVIAIRLNLGLNGAIGGRLVASLVGTIVAGWMAKGGILLRFDWGRIQKILSYCLPLVPMGLATYILFASDRFFLSRFYNLEIVAAYSFAYKVATTLDILIIRPFATDWAARRFKIATQVDAQNKYSLVLLFFLFAATCYALIVFAVSPELFRWLTPASYWISLGAVPVLLISYLIYGLSYPLNIGIMLKDKTRYLAIIGWVAAGVCLVLNYLLIPRYSMLGAAWSTLIAYMVWTVGITWISLLLYPVVYAKKALILIFAAALLGYFGITIVSNIWETSELFLSILPKLGWVFAIYGVLSIFLWRKREVLINMHHEEDFTLNPKL